MGTEHLQLMINGLAVDVVRKSIKNLHIGVYPPQGRVRVAAPRSMTDDAVRLAVVGKLAWIKKQRAKFESQPRQSAREMVTGETHYFFGRGYRLRVVEQPGAGRVRLVNKATLELAVRPGSSSGQREKVYQEWLRVQLKSRIDPSIDKWRTVVGVEAPQWGVKRMKTKWGSCNTDARRIWLNLELATKPPKCLEYVIVHELAHLLERNHNDRFITIMDRCMPKWRLHRKELNSRSLAHEDWQYQDHGAPHV